ncbi:MAG: hypothetical protein M1831_007138 [Alyxoria varia]|nr:MAG: hypothetical protein M1831_007138 [Alyxoria varia]
MAAILQLLEDTQDILDKAKETVKNCIKTSDSLVSIEDSDVNLKGAFEPACRANKKSYHEALKKVQSSCTTLVEAAAVAMTNVTAQPQGTVSEDGPSQTTPLSPPSIPRISASQASEEEPAPTVPDPNGEPQIDAGENSPNQSRPPPAANEVSRRMLRPQSSKNYSLLSFFPDEIASLPRDKTNNRKKRKR